MALNSCKRAMKGLKLGQSICKPSQFVSAQSVMQMQVRNRMRETPLTYLFGHKFLHKFDEKSRIYVIDGSLSVGKTTLAKTLAEKTGLKYFPEAHVHYIEEKEVGEGNILDPRMTGHSSLARFYAEPLAKDGHTFRFQFFMFLNRIVQYADALEHLLETGQGVVLERCAYSDMVFMDAIMEMGWAKKRCQDYYDSMRHVALHNFRYPHAVIYLDAPSEVLHKRFTEKGKGAEKDVPLEYFQKLEHSYINKYLPSMSHDGVEVLHYDWTKFGDPDKILADLEKLKFERCEWQEDDNTTLDVLYRFVSDKDMVLNMSLLPDLLPEVTISPSQQTELLTDLKDEEKYNRLYLPGYNRGQRKFLDILLRD